MREFLHIDKCDSGEVNGELDQANEVDEFLMVKHHDFEKAWQEAAASKAYSFTCTVSSGSVKAQAAQLYDKISLRKFVFQHVFRRF
ncbi:hypothetical protein HZA42_06060 [Candidatus Peregrinibacteria bacterium]|nr:hypothetical protein [Candidatus Peregrinibacteria bacterium]